jgi:branched-chain amino acid transport system substrate-binding protein
LIRFQREVKSLPNLRRRAVLGGIAAAPFAARSLAHAQSSSKSVKIGLISDMSSGFKDHGGPGNRVAMELAVADFGGSVLGRPIEILQADGQNKTDVAANIAREWFDDGVDAIADGAATSSGLGMQQVARDKKRTYLVTGPAASDFTGSACSPWSTHWSYDTYYRSGHRCSSSQGRRFLLVLHHRRLFLRLRVGARYTTGAVQRAGGKVLGAVRAPVGTPDFSGFLLQAKSSGAEVIALARRRHAELREAGGGI